VGRSTVPMYFVFCRLYSSSPRPPSSVWLLHVISLLITNTVSLVRACLSIRLERFPGTQKEDDRGPLIFNSSMGAEIFSEFRPLPILIKPVKFSQRHLLQMLAIRNATANSGHLNSLANARWRCWETLYGSHRMRDCQKNLLKIFAPHPLIKTHRMVPPFSQIRFH
jgi:hypothetical protein